MNQSQSGPPLPLKIVTQKTVRDLIKEFAGQANILTIPRIFISLTGDHIAALLLSQILYWRERCSAKSRGWFYKSHLDWEEELGLTAFQIRRAIKLLEKFGVRTAVRRVRGSGAPTRHYTIDNGVFIDTILSHLEGSLPTAQPRKVKKVDNQETAQSKNKETGESEPQESAQSQSEETQLCSLTEITTETTTESTAKNTSSSRSRLGHAGHTETLRADDDIVRRTILSFYESATDNAICPADYSDYSDACYKLLGESDPKMAILAWETAICRGVLLSREPIRSFNYFPPVLEGVLADWKKAKAKGLPGPSHDYLRSLVRKVERHKSKLSANG